MSGDIMSDVWWPPPEEDPIKVAARTTYWRDQFERAIHGLSNDELRDLIQYAHQDEPAMFLLASEWKRRGIR